jgi:NAD(P)-dependent dehydrogenase (short-subunit alcohol dehydrogenase family)
MPEAELRLDGRVAIVTGAGRGIGRATALALARQGARVVVNDLGVASDGAGHDTVPAESVVAEIRAAGGEAVASHDSVSDFEPAGRIVATALTHFGGVDVLVNNAGVSTGGPIWELEPEVFTRVVAGHLHGTYNCTRHAVAPMKARGWGRIVNLVSRAGLVGMPGTAAYAAGKGGVYAFTNVVSRDLAPFGITVNAVNPASTETRMVSEAIERFRRQGGEAERAAANLEAQLQRPDDVARVIAYLCSPAAAEVNGQVIFVRREEIAVYRPPSLGETAIRAGGWTLAALADAMPKLGLVPLDNPY